METHRPQGRASTAVVRFHGLKSRTSSCPEQTGLPSSCGAAKASREAKEKPLGEGEELELELSHVPHVSSGAVRARSGQQDLHGSDGCMTNEAWAWAGALWPWEGGLASPSAGVDGAVGGSDGPELLSGPGGVGVSL